MLVPYPEWFSMAGDPMFLVVVDRYPKAHVFIDEVLGCTCRNDSPSRSVSVHWIEVPRTASTPDLEARDRWSDGIAPGGPNRCRQGAQYGITRVASGRRRCDRGRSSSCLRAAEGTPGIVNGLWESRVRPGNQARFRSSLTA